MAANLHDESTNKRRYLFSIAEYSILLIYLTYIFFSRTLEEFLVYASTPEGLFYKVMWFIEIAFSGYIVVFCGFLYLTGISSKKPVFKYVISVFFIIYVVLCSFIVFGTGAKEFSIGLVLIIVYLIYLIVNNLPSVLNFTLDWKSGSFKTFVREKQYLLAFIVYAILISLFLGLILFSMSIITEEFIENNSTFFLMAAFPLINIALYTHLFFKKDLNKTQNTQ